MLNVANRLAGRKCVQSRLNGNALAKLHQAGSRQPLRQRWLPRQNNLKQFLVRRFKIRKQAHRLKHGVGEVLRLVDENYYAPSCFRLAK